MALELLELCQICECCFELCAAMTRTDSAASDAAASGNAKQERRQARDARRGFELAIAGRRIADIRFQRGAAEGKSASSMPDRELLRLVAAEPKNRALRLAVSRYLHNRRKGRTGPPPPVVQRG